LFETANFHLSQKQAQKQPRGGNTKDIEKINIGMSEVTLINDREARNPIQIELQGPSNPHHIVNHCLRNAILLLLLLLLS